MRRSLWALVLAAMVGGAVIVALGDVDQDVDLSAALELWGNVVRDTDGLGLQLTRVSVRDEMKIGEQLARPIGSAAATNDWTAYVRAVGESIVPYVRQHGITYTFTVIDAPEINAFALPGGRIFVMRGLLEFVESEAELAAVLGHEVSHVDLRHCIERYQYQLKLKELGLDTPPVDMMLAISRYLVTSSYSKTQELEADAQGLRMAVQAGYDPSAGGAVFTRLALRFRELGAPRARTPVGEVAQAVGGALGSYFDSHPPSPERSRRLNELVERNRRRLSGKEHYVGRQNIQRRVPRSQHEFPEERKRT
jgi:predicted Zn-dependent protease